MIDISQKGRVRLLLDGEDEVKEDSNPREVTFELGSKRQVKHSGHIKKNKKK